MLQQSLVHRVFIENKIPNQVKLTLFMGAALILLPLLALNSHAGHSDQIPVPHPTATPSVTPEKKDSNSGAFSDPDLVLIGAFLRAGHFPGHAAC